MIERKYKDCLGCNHQKIIFGHGLCLSCYRNKRGSGFLQQRKDKRPTLLNKKVKVAKRGLKHENKGKLELFNEIWEERAHVSEVNGSPLLPKGHNKWHWQFSHILPHGRYPEFELDKRNILLKTLEQHILWGEHIDKIVDRDGNVFLPEWEKVVKLRDELKQEYYSKYK